MLHAILTILLIIILVPVAAVLLPAFLFIVWLLAGLGLTLVGIAFSLFLSNWWWMLASAAGLIMLGLAGGPDDDTGR